MSKSLNIEDKLMFRVENEWIEYKEKLTDSLEKEVVAFLNAKGGEIFIGIKDNGEIIGIIDADKMQLQIKDRLLYAISPSTISFITISTENVENKYIIKISIKEGVEKPYYIKSKGLSESGAFIRIGASAQPMTQNMIYSLQSKSFPKSLITIESPEQDLTFADLFIHYRRFGKSLNDNAFAKTLNFLTKDGKYNYLAYLMADNNQISVRFARFNDAGERFELIEKGIEYGNCCLITAIQRILDRFMIENITLSKLTGAAHRIDKRLVDDKCLREIIINAFAHNDYSYGMLPIFEVFQDRIAVRSYGGLVPQLTVHDFFLGVSALRNPELMRILRDVELVEALGFGIREITKSYDKSIFEFTDNTVYVQLPFDKEVIEGKDESKGKSKGMSRGKSKGMIVELLLKNPKITVPEIAKIVGLSISGVEKNIRQLKQEGMMRADKNEIESKAESKVESKGKILRLMTENPKITVSEIAEKIGASISGVEKNIRQLKQEGIVVRTTDTKSGEWIVKNKNI